MVLKEAICFDAGIRKGYIFWLFNKYKIYHIGKNLLPSNGG